MEALKSPRIIKLKIAVVLFVVLICGLLDV